jgi:hypothetical protein
LCNPRDEQGNNATPSRHEVSNCSQFLRRQIELVDPKIVVTLGALALHAVRGIEDHGLELSTGVRQSFPWAGRLLIPLYHPGQRALLHRSFLNQLADYRFVAEQLKRSNRAKKARSWPAGKTSSDVAQIAFWLLLFSGPITYFRLHKLFYLLEYHHFRAHGRRLTSSYLIRQKDGPYFTDLHPAKLTRSIPGLALSNRRGSTLVSLHSSDGDLFSQPPPSHKLTQFVRRPPQNRCVCVMKDIVESVIVALQNIVRNPYLRSAPHRIVG